MDFPSDPKYSKDHEWLRVAEDGTAEVGITAYAASELGDIVYIDIESEDETLEINATFGSVEAVKTVSDLFMPVGGTVLSKNEELDDNPEVVNEDPYGAGWMVKIQITNLDELGELMDADTYSAMVTA